MNKRFSITMTLASIAVLSVLSGCGANYQAIKAELGNKAGTDNLDIRATYPVEPGKLAEVAEYAITNNGYRLLKKEETPDGFYVVGRISQQVLFFRFDTPVGALIRAKAEGGSEVVVVSKAKDKADDMLGWIADAFKNQKKFAAWVKPAAVVAAVKPVVAPVPGEVLNVAVSDFTADGVSASDASVTSNLLRNALVNTGAFNVVEKSRMDAILSEQAFQQAGCTEQDCAVKLGKLLNVKRMFIGSCGKLMGEFMVSVRVVDVESGKITFADDVKGESASNLKDAIKALAEKMAATRI